MTREEFIAGYCERSDILWAELSEWRAAVPCDCGDESCDGWGMVPKWEAPAHEWAHANNQTIYDFPGYNELWRQAREADRKEVTASADAPLISPVVGAAISFVTNAQHKDPL